jgi:uncharacterized protein (TIGR03083 family)
MDVEQSWAVTASQRRILADLIGGLSEEESHTPSLCAGWAVRDVAAHVALAPRHPGVRGMLVEAVRARGNFHRLNHDIAVRHAGDHPVAEIAGDLRAVAASRRLPVVTSVDNILFDTLVHVQDVAIPLGRSVAMPLDAAAAGATRVWTMGWPWWARRTLRGFRLEATDVAWSVGAGRLVTGPIQALLLLLTARPAALPHLSGDGVAALLTAVRN